MDPAFAEDIAASTLIAELAAAHRNGHLTGEAFWSALDCVRYYRQDVQNVHLRHAVGVINGLVRSFVAFLGSGLALEVYAKEVAKATEQRAWQRNAPRAFASVSTATQTHAVNIASSEPKPRSVKASP